MLVSLGMDGFSQTDIVGFVVENARPSEAVVHFLQTEKDSVAVSKCFHYVQFPAAGTWHITGASPALLFIELIITHEQDYGCIFGRPCLGVGSE